MTVSIVAGELFVAFGSVAWIYPPCGDTCNGAREGLAFVISFGGLVLIALGLAGALMDWRGAAKRTEEHRGPMEEITLREKARVGFLGIPPMVPGILLIVAGGAIFGASVAAGTAPSRTPISVQNNATSLIESGSALFFTGLMVTLAGSFMDSSKRLKEADETKPLALKGANASMWPVVSAMLREERNSAPASQAMPSVSGAALSARSEARALSRPILQEKREASRRFYIVILFIAITAIGLAIDYEMMLLRII